MKKHHIQTVLEAPLFGMAGVSGINSYWLAKMGCQVTLLDYHLERLQGVKRIWGELQTPAEFIYHTNYSRLPFEDNTFDFTWEWAGLWYLPNAAELLQELVRVSKNLILVAMPNNLQVGYLLRKYVIDRDTLLLPEVIIWEYKNDASEFLHPIFDAVWNATGWPRSMNYNEAGEFRKGKNWVSAV